MIEGGSESSVGVTPLILPQAGQAGVVGFAAGCCWGVLVLGAWVAGAGVGVGWEGSEDSEESSVLSEVEPSAVALESDEAGAEVSEGMGLSSSRAFQTFLAPSAGTTWFGLSAGWFGMVTKLILSTPTPWME